MSRRRDLELGTGGIPLTIVASLYYFALQPWAILARTVILILTFIFSKATDHKEAKHTPRMPTLHTLVEPIELKTKRAVKIQTSLNAQSLAKCHPQSQSPLFCDLPKELRDYIFELSCSQSLDEQHLYDANSYYYCLGHTSRLKTYTSLLRTCRRVWLEANAHPMRQAEHAFWFQRGPYDRHPDQGWTANVMNERDRYTRLFITLTTRSLRNVSHIHLFMQMFQAESMTQAARIEQFFPRRLVEKGFKPKLFTITLRSSDWSNWERGQPMSLSHQWLQKILDSPFLGGVVRFALELETDVKRFDQLDAIIEQVSKLEGEPKLVDPTGRDKNKACRFTLLGPPKSKHWSRSPRINNMDHEAYKGIATLQLRATTLVWKNNPCEMPDTVPQAAYAGNAEGTDRHAGHGFTVRRGAPIMIFRPRALRERLRSGGWAVGRFPEKEEEMRIASIRKAIDWEGGERERFEKMFGDIEAKRLLAEWERKASLLKFVD